VLLICWLVTSCHGFVREKSYEPQRTQRTQRKREGKRVWLQYCSVKDFWRCKIEDVETRYIASVPKFWVSLIFAVRAVLGVVGRMWGFYNK
jgi:hypothetical protein